MTFSTALDPTRPKQSFVSLLPGLINQYGQYMPRKDLFDLKISHNCPLPHTLRDCKGGGRGMYDLYAMRDIVGLQYDSHNNVVAALNHPIVNGVAANPAVVMPPPKTDDELLQEISDKFYALELVSGGVIKGKYRSVIASGPPGIGKTYLLEKNLQAAAAEDQIIYTHRRGYARATGLFRLMWEAKETNCVLLLDDADSIFEDPIALGLLKAALDTSKGTHAREISWLSEKKFETEAGEEIPHTFAFNGAIVFITNIDFMHHIRNRNSKLAPHLSALMTRSLYIDLNLRAHRELILHIRNVVDTSNLLGENGIEDDDAQETIMEYFETNVAKLREVSLRTIVHLCTIFNESEGDMRHFKAIADSTLLDPTKRH